MTEPSLALQKAIRARLIAAPDVIALVSADAIFDRSARPEIYPCINIGDGYSDYADRFESFHDTTFSDLHIWTEEAGTTGAKTIAGAIRKALQDGPWAVDDHLCINLTVARARFLRDPDGEHTHGVVTVETILQEAAS
jgi:Protein of unknown function (DUF3168)